MHTATCVIEAIDLALPCFCAEGVKAAPEVTVEPTVSTRALPAHPTTLVEADAILRAQAGVSVKRVKANLRLVYGRATRAQHASGLVWYLIAYCEAVKMARVAKLPVGVCAAIIAAHSPQTLWSVNVRVAWDCALGNTVTGVLGANVRRGEAVWQAARAAQVAGATEAAQVEAAMAALGNGPKVKAFAQNVAGMLGVVTVDVWAVRAALMPEWQRGMDSEGSCAQKLGRKGVYNALALVYAAEAKRVGLSPAEYQAVVWCSISNYSFGDDIVSQHAR